MKNEKINAQALDNVVLKEGLVKQIGNILKLMDNEIRHMKKKRPSFLNIDILTNFLTNCIVKKPIDLNNDIVFDFKNEKKNVVISFYDKVNQKEIYKKIYKRKKINLTTFNANKEINKIRKIVNNYKKENNLKFNFPEKNYIGELWLGTLFKKIMKLTPNFKTSVKIESNLKALKKLSNNYLTFKNRNNKTWLDLMFQKFSTKELTMLFYAYETFPVLTSYEIIIEEDKNNKAVFRENYKIYNLLGEDRKVYFKDSLNFANPLPSSKKHIKRMKNTFKRLFNGLSELSSSEDLKNIKLIDYLMFDNFFSSEFVAKYDMERWHKQLEDFTKFVNEKAVLNSQILKETKDMLKLINVKMQFKGSKTKIVPMSSFFKTVNNQLVVKKTPLFNKKSFVEILPIVPSVAKKTIDISKPVKKALQIFKKATKK